MKPIPHLTLLLALACGLGAAAARPAAAAEPEAVDRAIWRGVNFLYGRQKNDLQWENVPGDKRDVYRDPKTGAVVGGIVINTVNGGQWGGRTALCTYALLAAGESEQDERVKRAIEFLRRADTIGTYSLGVRAQVWARLPPREENRQAMARDARALMESMQGNAPMQGDNKPRLNAGLFNYLPDEIDRVDLSASQYGLLGLWAASRYGWEVPASYWQAAEKSWTYWQQRDGGWAYFGTPRAGNPNDPLDPPYPTSLSITAAGVASLYITLDELHANDGVRCSGNVTNANIDAGLKFLADGLPYLLDQKPYPDDRARRIAIEGNAGGSRFYTLYGIERIGVASGLKYLGDLDWYEAGADWLLKRQAADGSWGGEEETAFALLFLSRGREPVFMNKLVYQQAAGPARPGQEPPLEAGHWNQRPRDVANLARFVGESTERSLNWQSLSLRPGRDGLRELADAPVLYLAGDGEPVFSDDQKQTLRDYVYAGGLIVGNADCGRNNFEKAFQKLGRDLFPDYEFRVLEGEHPIFTQGQFPMKDVRRKPRLTALGNGAREFMVLAGNEDFARDWQLDNRRDDSAFKVGANLYLYATDKQPQPEKGRTTLVFADATPAKRTIKVARVQYNGRWDPEPGGWTRLAAVMHNRDGVDLDVVPVSLSDGDLSSYRVAHLTGTAVLDLPEAQAQKLKTYVDGGGLLIVDAAGGDAGFLQSIEAVLRRQLPDKADALANVLPISDPIYQSGPKTLRDVQYRLIAASTLGSTNQPRLRAIDVKPGRHGVILSNEDLSVGLNGSPVAGVLGYTPEDATRLMESMLLYATKDQP